MGEKGIALRVKGPKKAKRKLEPGENTDGVWPAVFMVTIMQDQLTRNSTNNEGSSIKKKRSRTDTQKQKRKKMC